MTTEAIRRLAVVVPARDEGELIGRCLHSVLAAADHVAASHGVETSVVVAADSCVDGTAASSRDILGRRGFVVEGTWANVGAARRAGVTAAIDRLGTIGVWIANTDADCAVPESWLTRQLDLASDGIDAVLGVVVVDSFGDHDPVVARRYERRYRAAIDHDGVHTHVHGANFGLRATSSTEVGGWPELACSEDHALAAALRSRGHLVAATASLSVTTSGRRHGRAVGGFADLLCSLAVSS